MLSPRAEALMMSADRAQHLDELVLPTLRAGKHVVSDRSAFSSLAYQGYGRMLDIDELRRFNNWAIDGHWPDLVVIIDVPLEQLLERLKKRELDRFEREDRAFFERIFTGFHAMAAADPARWLIVDGTPPKTNLLRRFSLRFASASRSICHECGNWYCNKRVADRCWPIPCTARIAAS
jgi:dTMP kinase